ncbi:MAG: NAD-binding protein, partial [Nocardioides sp.]|nr:NAD-binding protein [Nocardioides sp.]
MSAPVRAALRGAVVGGGTMGVGIAYVMATHGLRATVVEPSAERVRALRDEVDAAL